MALAFLLAGCTDIGGDFGGGSSANGDGAVGASGDDGSSSASGDDSTPNGDDGSASGDDQSNPSSASDDATLAAPGLDAADDETGPLIVPHDAADTGPFDAPSDGPHADAGDATVPQGTADAGADARAPVDAADATADSAPDGGGSDSGADAAMADADAATADADAGVADGASTDSSDGAVADRSVSDGHVADGGPCANASDNDGGFRAECCTTTTGCLQARTKPGSSAATACYACATAYGCFDPAQMGGTCEMVAGTLAHFAMSLPDSKSCSTVLGPEPVTEAAICIQTLQTVFLSQCAATLQETPCMCGPTPTATCLSGTATPTGPAYDLYACDFDSTSPTTILPALTTPTFGAGMGNAIIQCAASYGCDCF
jgi:hypothetical protein